MNAYIHEYWDFSIWQENLYIITELWHQLLPSHQVSCIRSGRFPFLAPIPSSIDMCVSAFPFILYEFPVWICEAMLNALSRGHHFYSQRGHSVTLLMTSCGHPPLYAKYTFPCTSCNGYFYTNCLSFHAWWYKLFRHPPKLKTKCCVRLE